MKTTIDTYPVFEPNQVLTDDHLNAVVEYLDEQERLTRANLIGIGITCGLEPALDLDAGRAGITRGCAVTSLGYLIIEHDDVALTGYREYKLPKGDPYGSFMDSGAQLPLWECFPGEEPDVTDLDSPADFLKDKSLMLFLERDIEDLSDCSPNNCDDKGLESTFTLRRLLVKNADLARITEKLRSEAGDSSSLDLPELRLRRFDTPRTGPVTTRGVLEAFQTVLKKDLLVTAARDAFVAAYKAFKPLLLKAHPSNPFDGFLTLYGFLEKAPLSPGQVAFMPCYLDLFSDLVAAYEEFRKRGLDYACHCCPSEEWFPRHVVLGPEVRTGWFPSAASCCDCESLREELVILFTRLVEIARRFGENPVLRTLPRAPARDDAIRITPSRDGSAPLSSRCIPYYYDFGGSPPLYQLWNPTLTRQKRAHHNQAYRSDEYSPSAPAFVATPLSFDLESYDFLRIEGHLGKDYRAVLSTLTAMRESNRLPFDVVAVRTGTADDSLVIDPAEHACRFQDLEAAYKILREELSCLAKKAIGTLGRVKLTTARKRDSRRSTRAPSRAAGAFSIPLSGATSVMGMSLDDFGKQIQVEAGTIGAAFIDNTKHHGHGEITLIGESAVVNAALSVLRKLVDLTALLAQDLYSVDWTRFSDTIKQLKQLSESIGQAGAKGAAEEGLSWQELNQHIVSVVFACRLEGFLSIRDEYQNRLVHIRKLATFGGYSEEHPAFQHKAGVPVGGTFVVVYHGGSRKAPRADDVYSSAVGRLDEGTVIADFCLPYQCCSDCAPVQFVVSAPSGEPPATAPTLTSRVGCTDADSQADVEITASGGLAPYELSVDGQVIGSFTTTMSVKLVAGMHTLQVTDDDGVLATPVTLEIPLPLTAGAVDYTDDTTAGTFTASFFVAEGTPPYAASAGSVKDKLVTVTGLQSGTRLEVVVTDAAGCRTTAAIEHEVDTGCDLPCNGKAARSRYPVWAPRPSRATPYQYKALTTWKVDISDEHGKSICSEDLTERVLAILQSEPLITETTYAAAMSKICGAVSTAVDTILAASHGPGAFIVGFDAKTGTLLIEAYTCHTFLVSVDFTLSGDGISRAEAWSYAREGIRVAQRAAAGTTSYNMPAFGRIDMDKCTNETGTDCAVDLTGVTATAANQTLTLTPSFGASVDPHQLEFHWRVDSPSLTYSRKQALRLSVDPATTVQVQLLVVERSKGCWAFTETSILSGRTPRIRRRR